MKIILAAPSTLPARRANTIQVMKMSQGIQQAGHQVHLAVPHPVLRQPTSLAAGPGSPPSPQSPAQWDELALQYGITERFPITWLPARPGWRGVDYAWQTLRLARRERADGLYTRVPQCAALASQLGLPTVLEVHDLPAGKNGPQLFRMFLKGRGARRLVIITRALARDLQAAYPVPGDPGFLVIAPDGVDLERFQRLASQAEARRKLSAEAGLDLPAEGYVVGYTGHLYPGRGREIILELAVRLPQITFLVTGGEPNDVQAFRTQVDAAGAKNILVTGFVPNQDIPVYQAVCDVLLMPYQRSVSASSGGDIGKYLSPMKLFEYLASGRPVISSDLPVLQEILNPHNSLLVPPDNVGAWMEAILALQATPGLGENLASQAWQDVQGYTWVKRADRIFSDLPSTPPASPALRKSKEE